MRRRGILRRKIRTRGIKKIREEVKETPKKELWLNIIENFFYGFIGATIVVFITLRHDSLVFIGYLAYYFYLGKVVNRPKYITSLGKFIVFPIPTAIGAFTGYKLAEILVNYFN